MSLVKVLIMCSQVFARTSPDEKAAIVQAYGEQGLCTCMCGDGTNDVAALKVKQTNRDEEMPLTLCRWLTSALLLSPSH